MQADGNPGEDHSKPVEDPEVISNWLFSAFNELIFPPSQISLLNPLLLQLILK